MILLYFMVSLFFWPMSLFISCWLHYLVEPNLASHLHQSVTQSVCSCEVSCQSQWEPVTITELNTATVGDVLVSCPEIFFNLHRTILCYMKAALAPLQSSTQQVLIMEEQAGWQSLQQNIQVHFIG